MNKVSNMRILQVQQSEIDELINSEYISQLVERKMVKETDTAYLVSTGINLINQEVQYEVELFNKALLAARIKGFDVLMIKKNPIV